MQLTSRITENVKILELSGTFDAYHAPLVRQWFDQIFEQKGTAYLVVNLKGINFLDSTGLSTLVQAMKHARQSNGDIRLCNVQQPVRMVLELTRLDRVFEIFSSEEDAVRAFTEPISPLNPL